MHLETRTIWRQLPGWIQIELSPAEFIFKIFRDHAILTHKNVKMFRAKTFFTFSLVLFLHFYKFVKQVWQTDWLAAVGESSSHCTPIENPTKFK